MKKFVCPLCNSEDVAFSPYGFEFEILSKLEVVGGGKREHVACSECCSTDRERLVYLYLKYYTKIFTDEIVVLHVAPELRLRKKIEANLNIEYISADLSKTFVHQNFDLCDIPFESNYFEIIIANHILEHILNDELAMKELYRVLKPDAIAILQVPFSDILQTSYEDKTKISKEDREICFGQDDHVRIYSRKDYIARLKSVGFEVEEFLWQEHHEFTKFNYALAKNEPIFIVKKSMQNS